jgi:hypothetical protein
VPINFASILEPEPLYTFVDPVTNQHFTFATERIAKSLKIKLLPDVLVPIDFKYGSELLEGGLDGTELQRWINTRTLPPITLLTFTDGKDIMVNGEYQYVAALVRGQTELLARRVPEVIWSEFLVVGVPFTQEDLNRLAVARKH